MLTPDQLRAMTPEQRTALFEKMCAAHYGDKKTAVRIAQDFDVTRETVFRWRRQHIVPWSAIFALDGWANSTPQSQLIVESWGSVANDLATATSSLSKIAASLGRIAKMSGGQ